MIYFDNAATTPIDPLVLEAMLPYLKDAYGNPSSLHRLGQNARAAVDEARMKIAAFFHCQPTELYFTANATESCNWAIIDAVERKLVKGQQAHIVTSSIEHPAVLKATNFLKKNYAVQTSIVPVGKDGRVDPAEVLAAITPQTVIVSVGMVNSEIGTVQPIAEIAELCQKQDLLFHVDACQAVPYTPIHLDEIPIDLLSCNASKCFGPKGVGLLYIREDSEIAAWTFGGDQEFGMRAGTENVPAIVGFGKALEIVEAEQVVRVNQVRALRDQLWEKLKDEIPALERNGSGAHSSPQHLNIVLPFGTGDDMVKKLDLAGFAVSAGSACASGKTEPSHVILALGHSEERAKASLRISLSHLNTEEEVGEFVQVLSNLLK